MQRSGSAGLLGNTPAESNGWGWGLAWCQGPRPGGAQPDSQAQAQVQRVDPGLAQA